MDRNIEIENRIKKRQKYDILHNIDSYGGMGIDCASANGKKQILEELNYIKTHPTIFNKSVKNDNSMYLIKLN